MHFSLGELTVIFIVALLVIKPERMPEVALKLGKGFRALRQLISNVKEEVSPLGQFSYESKRVTHKKQGDEVS